MSATHAPRPTPPNQRKHILTEGIDYLETGKRSVWGGKDKVMGDALRAMRLRGAWLNLACGDGRYNLVLLKKARHIVAADIDKSALAKVRKITPPKYIHKLDTKAFDMTKRFPFKAHTFDGIFNTGTLYLFPVPIFHEIIKEMDRVLKPGGMLLFDFATNITRERFDKKPYRIHGEPNYTPQRAKKILAATLKKYNISMRVGNIPRESYPKAKPPYWYSSTYLVVRAMKEVSRD